MHLRLHRAAVARVWIYHPHRRLVGVSREESATAEMQPLLPMFLQVIACNLCYQHQLKISRVDLVLSPLHHHRLRHPLEFQVDLRIRCQ